MTTLGLGRTARGVGLALCFAAVSVPAAQAQTPPYRYTRIASTATNPSAGLDGVYCVSINNQGTVVVHTSGAGASALWTGNGGAFTSVEADGVGSICASINDSGNIAYMLGNYPEQFVTSLVVNSSGARTVLARTDVSPYLWKATQALLSLNASGHAVFQGGEFFPGEGIYITPSTTVYNPTPTFHPVGSTTLGTMNDSDVVAFIGQELPLGTIGIYRGSLTPLVQDFAVVTGGTIRISPGVRPVINNGGTVAFVGSLAGTFGIYTTDDGVNMTLVGTNPVSGLSISDSGSVVYRKTLSAGAGSGIYIGRAGALDRPVIEQGQALDGSTVTDAFIWEESLNDEGQVAFWARLADGRHGIYRADPPTVVNITANGSDGPIAVAAGAPLLIEIGVDVSGAQLATANVGIGVSSPTLGVVWLGPAGFTLTPTVIYSGPLPDFGPVTLLNIPSTAGFPPGTYQWFLIVHDPATAVVTWDVVATTVQ
jgi:hypothetical protein